jgi:hypothetical protein
MSSHGKKHKGLKLPQALVEELALHNITYEEAIEGRVVIPDHQVLLRALRRLRSIPPRERAALEQRAREHIRVSGGRPAAN